MQRLLPPALLTALLLSLSIPALAGGAQLTRVTQPGDEILEQIDRLRDTDQSADAMAQLVAQGSTAVEYLSDYARKKGDLSGRGRAIVCLVQIGDDDAEAAIIQLAGDADPLVQTWAQAARIQLIDDMDELTQIVAQYQYVPALSRPIQMKVQSLVSSSGQEALLKLTMSNPTLQASLGDAILGFGPEPLIDLMLTHGDQGVRRQAAAYVATIGQRDPTNTQSAVLAALDYTPDSERPPWYGGPLWIPNIGWQQEPAQELMGHLIAWNLFCEHNGYDSSKTQIENNLRSVGLIWSAGMGNLYDLTTPSLLSAWGALKGYDALEEMLKEQHLHRHKDYKVLLENIEKSN